MNCWWECTKNELSALKNLQIDNSLSKFRIIATFHTFFMLIEKNYLVVESEISFYVATVLFEKVAQNIYLMKNCITQPL